MYVEPSAFNARLESMTYADWRPILAYIPRIQSTVSFGEYRPMAAMFPYWRAADIVIDFAKDCEAKGVMILFDWMNFVHAQAQLNAISRDFTHWDILGLCKLLTAILRGDRFNEGLLIQAFQKGLILDILLALDEKLKAYYLS